MKQQLLAAARQALDTSVCTLREQLAALDDASAGDTKSSAGDKFETSREMLQQERDRLDAQLANARTQLLALEVAERAAPSDTVRLGSCVELVGGEAYLLATGLGKVRLPDAGHAYVVSAESPVGAALLGRRVGEEFAFRNKPMRIVSIG